MDTELNALWSTFNTQVFGGELRPLSGIDYGVTSGEDGIGAHGVYFDKANAIVIDEKFRYDRAKVVAGDVIEGAKCEVVMMLLVHEMVHQALHQRQASKPGKHDEAFMAEAARISPLIRVEAPSSKREAEGWPQIHSAVTFLIEKGAMTLE
jgi:hypothetical protein